MTAPTEYQKKHHTLTMTTERKTKRKLSQERLNEDIDAYMKAGGEIEILEYNPVVNYSAKIEMVEY